MQEFINKEYEVVEFDEVADIYIINTCTVTNMSDRKSRQMLRKAKTLNENSIVVATGCYAQVSIDDLEKLEDIDLVIGNSNKNNLVNEIENFLEEKKRIINVSNIMKQREYSEFNEKLFLEKVRAEIKVQDGCDRFCSYCIIPYARGPVRSRNINNIIEEISEIAKHGIKEVVITGIHIASYGKDLKENLSLIDVLERANKVHGIERIRLGSLEPTIITEDFLQRLTKLDKICHHFHLSLQSGCNDTLKRMNRRYSSEQFYESVCLLRKYYNDVALTTDVIVGFPGETDEEFETTYNFLEKVNFSKMHIFKYSKRKGTVADKLPNQIDGNTKNIRSQRLKEMSNKNEMEFAKKNIGQEVFVLFEKSENDISIGHTSNYLVVNVEKANLENKLLKVKISNINKERELIGEVIC